MKNISHSRQRLRLINASITATPMIAMKLCACTSGNRPAMSPAASMRREGKEPKGEGRAEEQGRVLMTWIPAPGEALLFTLCALLFAAWLFALRSLCSSLSLMAAHHWVITITANGMPSRKPLCVTNKLVTALPQRQPMVTSGQDCVRVWDVPQYLKHSGFGFVDITKQHPPAESAVQNHDDRNQKRGDAIA